MNEIFSYKRFGKLIINDIVRYLPKYYSSILMFMAIMPSYWAFGSFLGNGSVNPNSRVIAIMILTFICTFLAPFRIYGSTNHKKWGVDFTMLPASCLEKFLSMLFISTILLPISIIITSIIIDTILVIIPTGYYNGYIFADIFTLENLKIFGEIVLFMCFALCGNMLFKKHKLSKTLLTMFAITAIISYLVSMGVYQYAKHITYIDEQGVAHKIVNGEVINTNSDIKNTITLEETTTNSNNELTIIERSGKRYNISSKEDILIYLKNDFKWLYVLMQIIAYVIIPCLMYYITFTRIKRQQL
ncbi:MAG: hypothetical protein RR312_02445 [Bacteroidales bacterium]